MSHACLLLACAVLVGSAGHQSACAQGKGHAPSRQESWACTAIPDRLWLPLSILKERLEAQGLTVLDAVATRDDCYTVRLRGADMVEKTVIFDPVSAKPLK